VALSHYCCMSMSVSRNSAMKWNYWEKKVSFRVKQFRSSCINDEQDRPKHWALWNTTYQPNGSRLSRATTNVLGTTRRVPSLVLIEPTNEGMARLSWPGWLIKYWDGANTTRTRKRSPIPVLTRSGTSNFVDMRNRF